MILFFCKFLIGCVFFGVLIIVLGVKYVGFSVDMFICVFGLIYVVFIKIDLFFKIDLLFGVNICCLLVKQNVMLIIVWVLLLGKVMVIVLLLQVLVMLLLLIVLLLLVLMLLLLLVLIIVNIEKFRVVFVVGGEQGLMKKN